MSFEKIGTTDNFTADSTESLPLDQFDFDKPYRFVGQNPERFFKLWDWKSIHPGSLEAFQEMDFEVRSCSWCIDGQAIMMQPFGTRTKDDCLQMSVTEFLENFVPLQRLEALENVSDGFKDRVSRLLH